MPALLERGQTFPDFTLEDARGNAVSSRSFYMRRNFVIAVLPNEMDDRWILWLEQLRSAILKIPDADGAVICLAIVGSDSADAVTGSDDRFRVLADPHGRMRARFVEDSDHGALIVADRYGAVFHIATGGPDQTGMNPDDVPGWIELIACRCS